MTATAQTPATYSVTEAARLIGISRSSAFEAARRGDLPGAIRIGHRSREPPRPRPRSQRRGQEATA